MATVNFSVPEEVKRLFNETFADRNKSAIIADLMVRAVEERLAAEKRSQAARRLLELRGDAPAVSEDDVRRAREELRS
ncbi:MAG: hypothetical protein WD273_10175 [Trueperaceae bacterium]